MADGDPYSDELNNMQAILNDDPHSKTGPSVVSVIRMGRFKKTGTLRPLKVVLSSSDEVLSVLRLKSQYTKKNKEISIAQNRTTKQRSHMRELCERHSNHKKSQKTINTEEGLHTLRILPECKGLKNKTERT